MFATEKTTAGTPQITHAANRCATVGDIKARRIFFPALAAFRSNILDAADLSEAGRDSLLKLLRAVDANCPTSTSWDEAMVKTAAERAEQRDLELVGSGVSRI
jgi:hypothetical protein